MPRAIVTWLHQSLNTLLILIQSWPRAKDINAKEQVNVHMTVVTIPEGIILSRAKEQ